MTKKILFVNFAFLASVIHTFLSRLILLSVFLSLLTTPALATPSNNATPGFTWELTQAAHGVANDISNAVASYGDYTYMAGRMVGAINEPSIALFRNRGFIRKLALNGDEVWTVEVDSGNIVFPSGSVRVASTIIFGIATDASGIYITGTSNNPFEGSLVGDIIGFVQKLDHDGNLLWTQQIPYVTSYAIAVYEGSVYVSGYVHLRDLSGAATFFNLSPSAFVRRYSTEGIEDWTKQILSNCDVREFINLSLCRWAKSYAVTADSTGVYIGGSTWGSLVPKKHAGHWDGWIIKYDHSGIEQWRDQFGEDEWDSVWGLASDGEHVVAVGKETQKLTTPGCPNPRRTWVGVIRTYNTNGNLQLSTNLPATREGVFSINYLTGEPCLTLVRTEVLGVVLTETGPVVVGTELKMSKFGDGDEDGFIRRYSWTGESLAYSLVEHSGFHYARRLIGSRHTDRGGESLLGLTTVRGNIVAVGATNGFVNGGVGTLGSRFAGGRDALAIRILTDGSTDWVHQFGTLKPALAARTSRINASSISNDTHGGAYVAYGSEAVVPGELRTSISQIHISHYKSDGELDWVRQIGSDTLGSDTMFVGIAADEEGLSVLWNDFPNYGDRLARRHGVVSRYSPDGKLLWEHRLVGSSLLSVQLSGIATYNSNSYVMGQGNLVEDGVAYSGKFLKAYDDEGTLLWTQRTDGSDGTGIDYRNFGGQGISVVKGGIYITGFYATNNGLITAHLMKLNLEGTPQWIVEIPGVDTTNILNVGLEVEAHGKDVYVLGTTREILAGDSKINYYGPDFFITRYNSNGVSDWTKQIGIIRGNISAHKQGVTLISNFGTTHRNEGLSYESGNNVVRRYDKHGEVVWTRQYGQSFPGTFISKEVGLTIEAESDRTLFIVGRKSIEFIGSRISPLVSIKKIDLDEDDQEDSQDDDSQKEARRDH